MDITPFAEALRRDLAQAAQAGTEEIRQAAERLSLALDPALRLTLMDTLSQAASEITNELEGTSVEVRLKGRDPVFVVVGGAAGGPVPPSAPGAEEPAEAEDFDEDDTVARITLRLPESLKAKAEELASRRGQSLNTWLVNAARAATTANININVSAPMGPGAPGRNRTSTKRIQGWVR